MSKTNYKHWSKAKQRKGKITKQKSKFTPSQFCHLNKDKKVHYFAAGPLVCMRESGCKERVRQSYLRETLTKDNDGNSAPQENRGQNTYK